MFTPLLLQLPMYEDCVQGHECLVMLWMMPPTHSSSELDQEYRLKALFIPSVLANFRVFISTISV